MSMWLSSLASAQFSRSHHPDVSSLSLWLPLKRTPLFPHCPPEAPSILIRAKQNIRFLSAAWHKARRHACMCVCSYSLFVTVQGFGKRRDFNDPRDASHLEARGASHAVIISSLTMCYLCNQLCDENPCVWRAVMNRFWRNLFPLSKWDLFFSLKNIVERSTPAGSHLH